MKVRWCWRCQTEMPMLDEEEYESMLALYVACAGDHTRDLIERFQPVGEAYTRLTGASHMHHNVIMHHRLALLGPDCAGCGKPLRTPRARMCPACGWDRNK